MLSLRFLETVCKTVRPMLSDRCQSVLSCSVCLSVCNVGVLWPNGWTDQDETWHACRPRPWPHCVKWGHSSPPQKGGGAPHPIFGPFLSWPNGWMHQDATWYGSRPQPRRLCVLDGEPAPSRKGAEPRIFGPRLLWPNGSMDQNATWYRGRSRATSS